MPDQQLQLDQWGGQGRGNVGQGNQGRFNCLVRPWSSLPNLLQVGLGTDVSGGFSPSILTAVQHASIAAKVVAFTTPIKSSDSTSFASRPLTIPTLFWLATLGGAQVCNLEHKIGGLQVGKVFDAIVVNIRNTSASSSPHNPGLWGVGNDEDLGLEIRRRRDEVGIANGDAKVDMEEEKKLKEELDAMLERLLFSGDDRNLRRVYVQGRWIGGTEGPEEA